MISCAFPSSWLGPGRCQGILTTAEQVDAVLDTFEQTAWAGLEPDCTRRMMSDAGSGYVSRAWRTTCEARRLRHLRTRAYASRTNGKAERFIQTLLWEWTLRVLAGAPRPAPALCVIGYLQGRRRHV